ncbi:MlaD family protein [Chitinibacteraceae bacterium HSL-7]
MTGLLRDRDPRFRHLGWRVGLFAGGALMLFVLALGYLAYRHGYFISKTRIHFVAEHGNGFSVGMGVRFSGFRIGVVDRVRLNDEAKVDVELLVEDGYLKWVKPDSTALLQQDGLVGDRYIEIVGGTPTSEMVKEGARLTFAPTLGLSEIALDLRQRTIPILNSVQDTLDYVNDPEGDVRGTVANLRQLTGELGETRKAIDQLVGELQRVAAHDVPAATAQLQSTLERTDRIVAGVEAGLPSMMGKLDASLGHINAAASDAAAAVATVRKTVDEAAPAVPGLVEDGGALVRSGNEVVDGVRRAWPVRGWVAEPVTTAPVPSSRE